MGQVVGETDRLEAFPNRRPLGLQDVPATVFHTLGIDPAWTLPGHDGRPLRLLDGEPITELI